MHIKKSRNAKRLLMKNCLSTLMLADAPQRHRCYVLPIDLIMILILLFLK